MSARAVASLVPTTLAARGRALGISSGDWPYGAGRDVVMQARLLNWAEPLGLRLAGGRCVPWLLSGGCRTQRCRLHRDGGGPRAVLSPRGVVTYPDNDNLTYWIPPTWMDHVTAWTRDGAPAVLVAQPYVLDDESRRELDALDNTPGLSVEIRTDGWYGHGTYFVGIWRTT